MADTTENIDELLAYLVSPEYLRMAANEQGEWNWQNAADRTELANYRESANATPNDGLADWERELLAPAPLETSPVSVDTSVTNRFGIHWDSDSQTCVCRGCRNRRRMSETPSLTHAERPVQLRARADNWSRFADVIGMRKAFDTRGSLRSRVRPESTDSGRLRARHAAASNLWAADQSMIDYVVYSYNTPIAWHVSAEGVDEWVYPDTSYSRTTSQHQAKIRRALAVDASPVRVLPPEVRS